MSVKVKDVIAIRITKNDEEIKEYLQQFPIDEQNKAAKNLLKFGIQKLQEDNAFKSLQETIKGFYELQTEKLEEIKSLLSGLQTSNMKPQSPEIETDEDDDVIDIEKASRTMAEALAMFSG